MIFSSKTPRDLNHDAEPYVGAYGDERSSAPIGSDGHYGPRPEFDHVQHNEPNPILIEFRRDPHLSTTERARDYLLYLNQYGLHVLRRFGPESIDHARKVLTRLVRLSA